MCFSMILAPREMAITEAISLLSGQITNLKSRFFFIVKERASSVRQPSCSWSRSEGRNILCSCTMFAKYIQSTRIFP